MEAINKKELPEDVLQWFEEATAGRRQSMFKIYGHNSRFILIRHIFESMYLDKNVHWYVFEWQEKRDMKTFLFKKVGSLNKVDKARLKKHFYFDLEKKQNKVN